MPTTPVRALRPCGARVLPVLALLLALVPLGAPAQTLQTHAERSGFTEFTPYPAMMEYLAEIQAGSTDMRLGVYGTTHEGRELPYAIFSRPAVTQPWEAWALGKPILVLAAGVHGPERTLRESVLLLVRELATPGTAMNAVLDDLVLLVVPQINPDGFSAPDGPVRGNLWRLDLNRDYMKLEQPEIQGYVQNILLEWAPHLFIDGHNGGSFPYNLNYQCPSHAEPNRAISTLCDDEIFPAIDRKLEEEGFLSWYYARGDENRWNVGGTDPRIGRNYGGFANMVGILFESPPSQELPTGVRSGLLGYQAVVEWARENPGLLMETVRTARIETVELGSSPRGEVAIHTEYEAEDRTVQYLIGVGEGENREIRTITSDSLMMKPVATVTRPRPWAYLVPRDAEGAVELLRRHRVTVEQLQEDTTLTVDAYTIGDITYERAYNHAASTRVHVEGTVTRRITLPKGTYLVRTGQMQGRVAAHLLEAESTDGVVYWNRLDAWLPKPEVAAFREGGGEAPLYPIFKLMEPTALPTRLLP
jgi:dipeptidyl-peptidase 4